MSRRTLTGTLIACALIGATLVVGPGATAGAATAGDEAAFTAAWQDATTTRIDLTADVTLTCAGGAPVRNSSTPIVVEGAGHTLAQSCTGDRVFEQAGTGQVTLSDVTVTGGDADNRGGAILSHGDVVVDRAVLRDNHTDSEGGAINTRSGASLDISNSTLRGNSADGSGGAIASQGLVTVRNSTLSGNTSGNNGGAVRAYGGLTVVNSTIWGNIADADGGAANGSPITLEYATIVGNTTGDEGANFDVSNGELTSFGSVIAEPQGDTNCRYVGSTTGDGYNLSDDASCGFGSEPGDVSDFSGDLGLGALAANGGPTETMLPTATSPLVDQIPNDACRPSGEAVTDQRGVDRPQGDACDIGAVEVEDEPTPTTTTPTTTTPDTTPTTGPGTTAPPAPAPGPAHAAAPVTANPTYTG